MPPKLKKTSNKKPSEESFVLTIDAETKIKQITPLGIDLWAEYYNQKYNDRGRIHHIVSVIDVDTKEIGRNAEKISTKELSEGFEYLNMGDDSYINLKDYKIIEDAFTKGVIEKRISNVSAAINSLREVKSTIEPIKILITFAQRENPQSDILIEHYHTEPLILTREKLICLRDIDEEDGLKIFDGVAKNLEVSLVRQKNICVEANNNKLTSIQSDFTSCAAIAIGILKDLTLDDVGEISQFINSYIPLEKMLKYSQSKQHISVNFPDLLFRPVKSDGTSLLKYIEKNKEYKNGNNEIKTRVIDKVDKIKSAMEKIDPSLELEEATAQLLLLSTKKDITLS